MKYFTTWWIWAVQHSGCRSKKVLKKVQSSCEKILNAAVSFLGVVQLPSVVAISLV